MAAVLPVSGITKRKEEEKRQLLSDVLLTLGTGGIPAARIAKGTAGRTVTRQMLGYLEPLIGRKAALEKIRTQMGSLGRMPQEWLTPVSKITAEELPVGTMARYIEDIFVKGGTKSPLARRIILDPLEARPTSLFHELGHMAQTSTKTPTSLKRALRPLAEEAEEALAAGRPTRYHGLSERHAREFAPKVAEALVGRRPREVLTSKEMTKIFKDTLEKTLKAGGWVP